LSAGDQRVEEALHKFVREHSVKSKGALSLVLVLTRDFAKTGAPIDPDNFLTAKGGQVKGLGGARIKAILEEHGISRKLSSEGSRTSRGSIERMRAYAELCNSLAPMTVEDWQEAEAFWIARVREYFASQPIRIPGDRSLSLQELVRKALSEAHARQRQTPGTMYEGIVLQHLVGAKLQLAAPEVEIEHHSVSQADEGTNRAGDFVLNETAVHVSVSPSRELFSRCRENLDAGLRCVVVTAGDGVKAAEVNARQADVESKIDIWEIGQFISTNICEWSGFREENRRIELHRLVDIYNGLVEQYEGDPSLRLEIQ